MQSMYTMYPLTGFCLLYTSGKNTNCVIAGHRGYHGAPYFREIERLNPGDKVYIKNPWEKLAYRVESIKIIYPDECDQIKIQKGKDMVTLVTCHPYKSHGRYRYLVYCVRDNGEKEEKKEKKVKTMTGITYESVSYTHLDVYKRQK